MYVIETTDYLTNLHYLFTVNEVVFKLDLFGLNCKTKLSFCSSFWFGFTFLLLIVWFLIEGCGWFVLVIYENLIIISTIL
jgi:hypothetical protein